MKTVRVLFEKTGRCIYISHLDLTRAMGRALARSCLPVWYTEGFHPHLYMTFALPLSLGTAGMCETMDYRLLDDDFDLDEATGRLDAALPEGLHAVRTYIPQMQPKQIMWADYRIDLRCDYAEAEAAVRALEALPVVETEKRSKKGIKTVDIRPMFSVLGIMPQTGGACLCLRCRAGVEINLNPSLVLGVLEKRFGFSPFGTLIARTAVKDENYADFL